MKVSLTFLPLWLVLSGLFALPSANAGPLAPDTNFRPPFFGKPLTPTRAMLLPDGKYVLFFGPDTLTDQPTGPITRFLADGTLDTAFNFSRTYKGVSAATPASDGKLYIAASRYVYGRKEAEQILRLNADGSIDSSFTPATVGGDHTYQDVRQILVQPDGKVLVAGLFITFAGDDARDGIVRLMPDGAVDMGFAPVTLDSVDVWSAALQPDGKVLIGGMFSRVNGVTSPGIARLNTNGSLDSTFQSGGFLLELPVRGIAVQSDAKIILSGRFRFGSGPAATRAPLVRLNDAGSLDSTFSSAGAVPGTPSGRDLFVLPDGKIIAAVRSSIYRFNTNGSKDTDFRQAVMIDGQFSPSPPIPGSPVSVHLLPDGRILTGGNFTDVDPPGAPTYSQFGVARLNSDGTLDSSLVTSHKTGSETAPSSFARLDDGSTLIGFGGMIDPPFPYNVGRLLSDGSRGPNFTLSSSDPNSFLSGGFLARGIEPLPDGNFFVFGQKTAPFAFTYGKVAPNGVHDTAFATEPIQPFQEAIATPDGKILLAAGTDAQATVYETLTRLKADGHYDSFSLAQSIREVQLDRYDPNGFIVRMYVGSRVLAVQPDGKILFVYLRPNYFFYLVRLNTDGSIDGTFAETAFPSLDSSQNFPIIFDPVTNTTYQPPEGVLTASLPLLDAHVQADGRIILVGHFTSYNATAARGIVRLEPNGAVDNTFNTGGGAQWNTTVETSTFFPAIEQIEVQADGDLLIAGTFEAFNGAAAPGIASLNPDGSVDASFAAPALRDKHSRVTGAFEGQKDGSFLLSGPYSFPNEANSPTLIRLVGPPTTAVNISTRMAVGTGENVLIAGFIITGNVPKKVIIRGIGPSLSSAGAPVAGRLEDTVLALHRGDGSLIVSNDDWRTDQEQEIIDSTIQPGDSRESAIVQTLQPGNYTAILSGKNNTTGIGLVEVYDLDSGATSELAQISTRGFVQTGDNVMIGGFIVSGAGGSANVLLRAIGPTLAQAGVNGALQDTVLELFNGSGTSIAVNDDWRTDQEHEIINTTVPPTDNRESAILRSLNPGNYTAIVRGKDNTTGVALVEAYVLQ